MFETPRIESGETQWGEVDLEWFRRDLGKPIMVEIELYALLHADSESDVGVRQVTRLSLSCL